MHPSLSEAIASSFDKCRYIFATSIVYKRVWNAHTMASAEILIEPEEKPVPSLDREIALPRSPMLPIRCCGIPFVINVLPSHG